jgi:hypothetical protein
MLAGASLAHLTIHRLKTPGRASTLIEILAQKADPSSL